MSRFNARKVPTVGPKSAIGNSQMSPPPSDTLTHEGGKGWSRDAKSELFLLAASFMGGDDNFYEKESDRYGRLRNLINDESVYSDQFWLYDFINWLRNDAQMRTVSMVVGIESAHARASRELYGVVPVGAHDREVRNRDLVSIALSRADEPAEALAYWRSHYGKMIPQYVKNGVGDAAVRLYNEKSFLKYGKSTSSTVSMRDVLRLTHPTPKAPWQNVLFEWITHENEAIVHNLSTISARRWLSSMPRENRIDWLFDSENILIPTLGEAGMTWENLSEWSPEGMTGRMWDVIIPSMGYMALLRNLRNFDQAGISRESVNYVAEKLQDSDEVAKSRQLPYRFYSAYRAVESLRWHGALDNALTLSLRNIPKLFSGKDRKTLVLVDRSGSMFDSRVSTKSDITYAEIAALFGSAWKLADPSTVDLYEYGSEFDPGWVGLSTTSWSGSAGFYADPGPRGGWYGVSRPVDISRGGSILPAMEKFRNMGGTKMHQAIAETWQHGTHSRLILITDEQSYYSMYDDLPVSPGASVYIWNLGGYKAGTTYSGRYNRHSFGGLTDQAFKLIPILEAGRNTGWPWDH